MPISNLRHAALALVLCGAAVHAQTGPQMDLPRTDLSAGLYRIDAQVAATPEQREVGLMFRRDIPPHEGMLFVFQRPGVQCFWMRNTLLPLTAAFVADDGTIVNLADMQPQSDASHCSETCSSLVATRRKRIAASASEPLHAPTFSSP